MAQLVWRHSCVADRLLVVDRIPAGPWVRLKLSGPCLRAETAVDSKKYTSIVVSCMQAAGVTSSARQFSRRQVSGWHVTCQKNCCGYKRRLQMEVSIAPGTYSMQNCPYRNKDVEQAKVVDLLYECGLVYITDFTRRVFGAE